MNSYDYKITNEVYNYIVNGTKRLEIRLYNDKSSKINIGDYINFSVLNNDKKRVKVQVKALLRYKNIDELLNDFDINIVIDKSYNKEKLSILLKKTYEDKLESHNLLGIKFEIIKPTIPPNIRGTNMLFAYVLNFDIRRYNPFLNLEGRYMKE